MKKLSFLMCLHGHQPSDNSRDIFEQAYKKSYEPFLDVLERHPRIKTSFHFSGPLLEWLIYNKPDFINKLQQMVKQGRVELLTGGYFEPILPVIPERDTKGQIDMFSGFMQKHLDYTPRGLWLTERVWDPSLASVLKDLRIDYTILDDFHLRLAGVEENPVFGHYTIGGHDDFHVFASIKKL